MPSSGRGKSGSAMSSIAAGKEATCTSTEGRSVGSSTGPFRVDGREQPLGDFPRHDSPWGTVDHLATSYALDSGSATWSIDADGWVREVS